MNNNNLFFLIILSIYFLCFSACTPVSKITYMNSINKEGWGIEVYGKIKPIIKNNTVEGKSDGIRVEYNDINTQRSLFPLKEFFLYFINTFHSLNNLNFF